MSMLQAREHSETQLIDMGAPVSFHRVGLLARLGSMTNIALASHSANLIVVIAADNGGRIGGVVVVNDLGSVYPDNCLRGAGGIVRVVQDLHKAWEIVVGWSFGNRDALQLCIKALGPSGAITCSSLRQRIAGSWFGVDGVTAAGRISVLTTVCTQADGCLSSVAGGVHPPATRVLSAGEGQNSECGHHSVLRGACVSSVNGRIDVLGGSHREQHQ